MRNSFKNSWLTICLLASVAMIGCGGGGGGGGSKNPTNPVAPTNNYSTEITAAQSAVSSVLANANVILGKENPVNASSRTSISGNVNALNNNEIGNSVVKALETPKLLRAVLGAVGGNIDSGLFVGTGNEYNTYMEVASYSNNVYERTLYLPDYYSDIPTNENEPKMIKIAHYLIEGCECKLDGTTLKSFAFNPNAKITIEEFYDNGNLKNLFKGTIDTDLKATYEVGEVENLRDTYIDVYNGNKIPLDDYYGYWAFKATQKITSKVTYTLNKPIVIKLVNSSGNQHSYNHWMNWDNNDNPIHITELKEDKFSSNNLNITISGISGTITPPSKTTFYGNSISRQPETGEWADYKDIYGEENPDDEFGLTFTSGEKTVYNLKYASTCEVSINGDITNKQSFGSDNTGAYWDSIETTPTANRSGKINNVNVKLRNVSGDLDKIIVGDAEAHVDVGDYTSDEILMIGDQEIAFNKAKIDITGLKYDYRWEPSVEEGSYQQVGEWYWEWVANPEYDKQFTEMNRKCFGNAIVHLDAEESKNSVTIKADCDINKQTATLNLVNNGNYIVKDKTSSEKVLEFNFKTVDVTATKVDIIADNKCDGAILEVTGVEKDGNKSVRTYNVVKGKLVLDKNSQKDKQAPVTIPEIEVKEEIQDSSSINEAFTEEVNTELKNAASTPTVSKSDKEILKIIVHNDGTRVATFEKKKSNSKEKDITSKIRTTKENVIAVVSFYGNDFTFVFYIDMDKSTPTIKGGIFEGKKTGNIAWDSPERIGYFAGEGKTMSGFVNGSQFKDVPLN